MSLVSAASTAPSTTPSLHAALPISEWDGVRNYQARNIMSQMKRGDLGFFYHSGSAREIVGIVEVVAETHPDSTDDTGTWTCVEVAAREALPEPVSLQRVKATPELQDMVLVKNSRLSVQPVTAEEWAVICRLGGLAKAP